MTRRDAIQRQLAAALRPFVGRVITPEVVDEATAVVLAAIVPIVRIDEGNNPPESIAEGKLVVDIYYGAEGEA